VRRWFLAVLSHDTIIFGGAVGQQSMQLMGSFGGARYD
jgi:hypothetical protein